MCLAFAGLLRGNRLVWQRGGTSSKYVLGFTGGTCPNNQDVTDPDECEAANLALLPSSAVIQAPLKFSTGDTKDAPFGCSSKKNGNIAFYSQTAGATNSGQYTPVCKKLLPRGTQAKWSIAITESSGTVIYTAGMNATSIGRNRRGLPACQSDDSVLCNVYTTLQCKEFAGNYSIPALSVRDMCPALCGACRVAADPDAQPQRNHATYRSRKRFRRTRLRSADWADTDNLLDAGASWPVLLHTAPKSINRLGKNSYMVYSPVQRVFVVNAKNAADASSDCATGGDFNLIYACREDQSVSPATSLLKGLWWNSHDNRVEGFVLRNGAYQLFSYGSDTSYMVSNRQVSLCLSLKSAACLSWCA